MVMNEILVAGLFIFLSFFYLAGSKFDRLWYFTERERVISFLHCYKTGGTHMQKSIRVSSLFTDYKMVMQAEWLLTVTFILNLFMDSSIPQ